MASWFAWQPPYPRCLCPMHIKRRNIFAWWCEELEWLSWAALMWWWSLAQSNIHKFTSPFSPQSRGLRNHQLLGLLLDLSVWPFMSCANHGHQTVRLISTPSSQQFVGTPQGNKHILHIEKIRVCFRYLQFVSFSWSLLTKVALGLVPPWDIRYGPWLSVVFVCCAMLFNTQSILNLDQLKCQIFLWWCNFSQQSSLGSNKYKRQEGKNVVYWVDNAAKEKRWGETCFVEEQKNDHFWERRLKSLSSTAKEDVSLSGCKFGSCWAGPWAIWCSDQMLFANTA